MEKGPFSFNCSFSVSACMYVMIGVIVGYTVQRQIACLMVTLGKGVHHPMW